MPRSYRGILCALVGLVLAGQHPQVSAQSKQPDAQERSASALENIASRYDQQAKRAEGSRETDPCEQGDDKRYSDLCAQWKAADAAADSAWWAGWATWIGGISGLLVLAALGLAFQSNRIARDTAKRQLRAYVAPTKIRLSDPGTFQIRLHNDGATPARNVRMRYTIAIEGGGHEPNFALDHWIPSEGDIAPGRSSQYRVLTTELFQGISRLFDLGGAAYVVGEVEYADVFGDHYRRTFKVKANKETWEHNPSRFYMCKDGNTEHRIGKGSV